MVWSKPGITKEHDMVSKALNPETAVQPGDLSPDEFGGAHRYRRGRQGTFAPVSFEFAVRPSDIAGSVEQLRKNGRESTWMVFLFDTVRKSQTTDDQGLALQYSVIDGRIGLDWVLLGPRNAADAQIVAAMIRSQGHHVERREMNRVPFLRVEDGDLATLGENILETLYGVPAHAELGLIIDGIVLSSGKRSIQ
jgi:hypothetical protein